MDYNTHGTELFSACFRASLNEMRLLLITAKNFNPEQPKQVSIYIKKWNDLFEKEHRNGRSKILKSAQGLTDTRAALNEKQPTSFFTYHYINKSTPINTTVEITIANEAREAITTLKELLTDDVFDNAVKLNTGISIRLYLWIAAAIKANPKANRLTLNIEWLRSQLGMLNRQKVWTNFKGSAIEHPLSKINEALGKEIKNTYLKDGRIVHAVELSNYNI